MSRYIDYDALDYKNWHMIGKSSDFIDGVVYMAQRIEEAPSIDLADYVPKDFHDKTCEAMAKRHTEEMQKFMWIPCSERLPEENGRYLVTFPTLINKPWIDILWYGRPTFPETDHPCFYASDDEYGDVEYDDVVAWMPLPEPYGEREGE